MDEYLVAQEPQQVKGGMSGRIVHVVNDVNANMTKNYANRLSGALVGYINEQLDAGTVEVVEQTRYQTDIPWDESFAVSTLVFGAMLAGLLFGQLSMTSEWENNMMGTLALAPCRTSVIVTGKVCAALLKALVASGVLVGVVAVMFSVVPQSPWHLALALVLSYVIFASLGVMLGTVVRSPMTAFLISLVCSLCLWVAGGGFGDLSYFGDLAQLVGVANPATYALDIARFAYFGGALEPAALVAMSLGAVITAGGCAFLFSVWIHSEKVAR